MSYASISDTIYSMLLIYKHYILWLWRIWLNDSYSKSS
nr:MAG TPA: hypothetical protein [Caudoviricetes sp.]